MTLCPFYNILGNMKCGNNNNNDCLMAFDPGQPG